MVGRLPVTDGSGKAESCCVYGVLEAASGIGRFPRLTGAKRLAHGREERGHSYSDKGGQVHTRLRSPYTLSTRATGGQYFASRSSGTG